MYLGAGENWIFSFARTICSWICSPLKKYLSVGSHELLTQTCWKMVYSSSLNESEFSPEIYPGLFPASTGGPVAANHRQDFFDPTGSNPTTIK